MTTAQEQAVAHVRRKMTDPGVFAIEKDAPALRQRIPGGAVVEVTEDTFVVLTSDPRLWDRAGDFRRWQSQVEALGYDGTLFIQRFEPDPAEAAKMPALFAGRPCGVAGTERPAAARCFTREDGTLYLWAEARVWPEPDGKPGCVTCDFFLQSVHEEWGDWREAEQHGRFGSRRVWLPEGVLPEVDLGQPPQPGLLARLWPFNRS
ncbi:MAG TPA: hypothetical protein VFU47_02450 [Armatimonadota bacterium]|nr:hypothetical protein [Armatimonadota bacterium]